MLSALIEGRDPYPNAVQSANITCVGILAHESALAGGKVIPLPSWTHAAKKKSPGRKLLAAKR